MKLRREKYYTPFIITSVAVIISLLIFFIQDFFIPTNDFYDGLTKAIVFPIAISLPISLFTTKYHKKIYNQKKELEKLNELNHKLISIIAHDIRSPLSIVHGFIDILHEDVDKNNIDKIHFRLHNITERIDHLLLFLNDLLKWSKNQINLAPIHITNFSTQVTLDTIIQSFENIQTAKNITTSTNIQVKEVSSDKEIYSFIVRNLYHNALKFSKNNGKIHIELTETENQIHTTITDYGIGISEEDLVKIKDDKQWFSTTGTFNEAGTGLGIKTILQYLKICNGELIIDSKLNYGTSIKVILPQKIENLA